MKIKGIPVGTPMKRSDWNQTDPRKADYIMNKPDMCGLGAPTGFVADLNTCLVNGWYGVNSSTKNIPEGFEFGSVHVRTRYQNQVAQYLYAHLDYSSIVADGCQMIRSTTDNGETWLEEWVNPPMVVDKEYRTTERKNSKAVYKKLGADGIIYWRTEDEATWHSQWEYVDENFAVRTGDYITSLDELSEFVVSAAYEMSDYSVRQFSLMLDTPYLYSASLLTLHRGMNDDQFPEVLAVLEDSSGNRLCNRFCSEGVDDNDRYVFYDEGGWAWDNPPMERDTEYRTTELYDGWAVYKKLDKSGNVLWRPESEETWRYQDIARVDQPFMSLDELSEFIVPKAYDMSDNSTKRFSMVLGIDGLASTGMLTLCRTITDDNFPEVLATIEDSDGNKVYGNYSTDFPDGEFYRHDDWAWDNPPMYAGVEYRTTERKNGKAVYKKMDSDGVLKYRLDGETVWKTYAHEMDAAPAGYGYGGTPTYLGQVSEADLDSVLDNFISTIEDDTPHQVTIWIEGMSVSLCTVIRGSINWACVRGFTFAGTQGEWVKHKNNGTWLPLEWVNAPMDIDVEYRTTERYNGKAVYKMLDPAGDLLWRLEGEWAYRGKLELIASGETTEAVNTILVTQDNYGNPLSLRDMVTVYVECPPAAQTTMLHLAVNGALVGTLTSGTNTNGTTYGRFMCVYSGKKWDVYGQFAGNGSTVATINSRNAHEVQQDSNVTSIKLLLATADHLLPVGFKYEIYGRRA